MDQRVAAAASHGATFSPKRWWSHPVPANTQSPPLCTSCKDRGVHKIEHGLEVPKVPSAQAVSLPQGFHQLHPHHAADGAPVHPHPPHANPQGHHDALHLLPQRDVAFHKHPAEGESHTNVFYTAVQEQTGLNVIKGPFATHGPEKPSIKFPLYTREDDDEYRAVNPCVMAAATVLIVLTLSVILFLFKSSQLMAAMEKTTPTEEPTTGRRPRDLEVANLTSETISTRERSSTVIVHSSAADEPVGVPLVVLKEATVGEDNTSSGVS